MNTQAPLFETPEVSSVQDMLIQSARHFEKRRALTDFSPTPINEATYGQLLHHVRVFGTALKKLGLKERAHIALIGENRVQWGVAYLTAACYNYVIVPVDKNLGKTEILNIIHESDAQAVIFSGGSSSHFESTHTSLKKIRHYIHMDLPESEGEFLSMKSLMDDIPAGKTVAMPKIDPDEMSIIVFTSGSLGRAKGVMLSQKNIVTDLMGMVRMVRLYPEDRFLSVLPIHHTYECTCGFLCPLYKGCSVWFARSLKTILDDLKVSKATIMLGVPLLYEKMYKNIRKGINEKAATRVLVPPMLNAAGLLKSLGWSDAPRKLFKSLHEKFGGNIRLFIAGGAAPDPEVAAGLRRMGFMFLQGYGLTETAPILTLNRLEAFKDEAAGLPLPGVALKIHEPDENGVGEVWAKGDNVMLGYYKNEQATRESISEDGWFRTGDLGHIDKDGFLHISGRKKNVIIAANGKNVFPEELEDLLNRSPYIQEVMVYGQSDSAYNEKIVAQIVVDGEALISRAEAKKKEITSEWIHETIRNEINKVNKQLASFKRIQDFIIREEEFAKTTTQKIKRYMVGKDPRPISTEEH
ncbi:AMP-binding protein [Balneolales bacterium ANBcel1]|nr:AMP-binding protein [Balneolales bacterium ANBcel1]